MSDILPSVLSFRPGLGGHQMEWSYLFFICVLCSFGFHPPCHLHFLLVSLPLSTASLCLPCVTNRYCSLHSWDSITRGTWSPVVSKESSLCCYLMTPPLVQYHFISTGLWSHITPPISRVGHTSLSTPSHFWEELGGPILQPESISNGLEESDSENV